MGGMTCLTSCALSTRSMKGADALWPAVRAAVLVCGLALSTSATGDVLRVGPSRDLQVPSQAAAVAKDGDTILIDTGTYSGDVAAWHASRLTIRGVDANDQPVLAWLDA